RFAAFTGLLIAVDRLFRYRHGVLASWLLRASRHLVTKGAPFALPFIVALGFAFLADYLGLHFVVGAFFGPLLVAEHVIGDRDAKDVRAAMELVVAAIGLELGLIDESLFSILVLMGVVTTFLMTLGLRFVLPANIRDRLAFGSSTAEQGSGGINGGA